MVFEEHLSAFRRGSQKPLNLWDRRLNPRHMAYNVEQIRPKYPKAYSKWIEDVDVPSEERISSTQNNEWISRYFSEKAWRYSLPVKEIGFAVKMKQKVADLELWI